MVRAGQLGAYREMYGYDSPADAIGPEPGRTSPEARADWHTVFAALGSVDGIDLRGCSDGQLYLRRSTYEQETSWAPPYVAEDLRLARLQMRTAYENIIREEHESRAATDPETARRHEQLAIAWRDMEATATRVAGVLAQAQETRRQWEALTEPTRQTAVASDQELRRRHPDRVLEPLRSAEPGSGTPEAAPRADWAGQSGNGPSRQPGADAAGGRALVTAEALEDQMPSADPDLPEAAGQLVQGLACDPARDGIPERITRISQDARAAQAKLDELRDTRIPSEDTEVPDLGPAWRLFPSREHGAIVQPARPDIVPASEVLHRAEARRTAAIPEAENT